jgi:putative transcriptional regulator
MHLDNDIKKIRTENNITQEQLAEAVGVSRQTIIAIEKGNYIPSLGLGIKLGEYFKLPVEKIFFVK